MRLNRLIKAVSLILMASMINLCWLTSYGWTEIAATDSVIAVSMQISADREKIRTLLNREDVQHQLETYGISHEEALARVNSLTNEEIAALVMKIDSIPAGAGSEGYIIFAPLVAAVMAFALAGYILGFLVKGVECIFSDCEEKGGWTYVFTPFWDDHKEDDNSSGL